ncbi:MAG: hypothetical protein ACYDCK_03805 [Thermoplasmatota archaeon]
MRLSPRRFRSVLARQAGLATIVLLLAALPLASADTRPSWIPPDTPAGPVVTLTALLAGSHLWQPVTTTSVTVLSISCPTCDSATVSADFTVGDSTGAHLRVHVPNTWQATWNVKKQNFLPAVGQRVVVQGEAEQTSGGERFVTMKRFGEIANTGPTVHAYDVAAGKYATGTYAWISNAVVLNRGRWTDGDVTWDIRDPVGGGLLHLELSPPYYGQLHLPNMGDIVHPYGQLRFDPDHNWWELHPVRCWSTSECVPSTAGFVTNAPPAGSPTVFPGSYEQGGDVPVWVPMDNTTTTPPPTGTTFNVTFAPTGNEWWVQTTTRSDRVVATVDASVDSGAWVQLTAYSWGWAKSIHAPPGSLVQFRAHAADGSLALSPSYLWPPGTTATPPPSSGNFTATFTPCCGNDWWVQVTVTSGTMVTGVDAQVGTASWVALDAHSYGWAKSISAPAGVHVTFRAHASDGSVVTSATYVSPV